MGVPKGRSPILEGVSEEVEEEKRNGVSIATGAHKDLKVEGEEEA